MGNIGTGAVAVRGVDFKYSVIDLKVKRIKIQKLANEFYKLAHLKYNIGDKIKVKECDSGIGHMCLRTNKDFDEPGDEVTVFTGTIIAKGNDKTKCDYIVKLDDITNNMSYVTQLSHIIAAEYNCDPKYIGQEVVFIHKENSIRPIEENKESEPKEQICEKCNKKPGTRDKEGDPALCGPCWNIWHAQKFAKIKRKKLLMKLASQHFSVGDKVKFRVLDFTETPQIRPEVDYDSPFWEPEATLLRDYTGIIKDELVGSDGVIMYSVEIDSKDLLDRLDDIDITPENGCIDFEGKALRPVSSTPKTNGKVKCPGFGKESCNEEGKPDAKGEYMCSKHDNQKWTSKHADRLEKLIKIARKLVFNSFLGRNAP